MHGYVQSTEGYLVEHFQQHASAEQLGKALWQSDVRPPLDTNVGISTRLAFRSSISTAVNIGGGARLTRSACVFVGQSALHLGRHTALYFWKWKCIQQFRR
jgi:hypothetical protein